MAASPISIPVTFTSPETDDSFTVAHFGADTPWGAAGASLPAWCMRFDVPINTTGLPYTAYAYSSYESTTVRANLPVTVVENLDNVNWLLNHYRSGTSGYSATEVQDAVWQLMHQLEGTANTALTELALANDGYVPDAGEVLAVIVEPVRADGTHDQTSIIETKAAKLGDRVWEDADADGLQDAGEAGIAGATVQLVRDIDGDGKFSSAGEVLASTTTDANGNYSFKGLTPGLSYQVQFVAPAGYDAASARQADGSAASGANSDGKVSDLIVLAPGEYNASVDSGFYKYASIGNKVWSDTNGNGLQDAGEAGKAGVNVQLYTSVDGEPGKLVSTQTTDANGSYDFAGLKPGDYILKFVASDGSVLTTANVNGDQFDALDSDAGAKGLTGTYSLGSGEHNTSVAAGFYMGASIGDRVWNDANANGVQDAGENGKSGVTVELYTYVDGAPGELVASKVTASSGAYSFTGLKPGDYMVRFIAADGSVLSSANVGSDALDSDAGSDGFTGSYTLAGGDNNTSVDAGFHVKPPVTNPDQVRVFEDGSTTFNVLANDASGLKLVGVAHESAALNDLFQSRGGAINFTTSGRVSYDSMTNYYGNDKLVYTVEDAAGFRTTQVVDVSVTPVSDAPRAASGAEIRPSSKEYAEIYGGPNDRHWVYTLKLSDFGNFSDSHDRLQQFGNYNLKVANDTDSIKSVVITGLKTSTGKTADLLFNGKVLDFSHGQTYTYSVAQIQAGKLQIDAHQVSTKYIIGFQYIDTGSVSNNGEVTSNENNLAMHSPTPIALDLNGDGHIGVTGATASADKDAHATIGRTVRFDIDADSKLDTIEWYDGSGDGILIDNRDGGAAAHMDGSRLFGDQGGLYADGYVKLRLLDANGDGKLSGSELAGIELWVDNGDAVVQEGELQTLAQHGIVAISTEVSVVVDAEGRGHLQSSATRADGSTLMSEDVYFAQVLPEQTDLLASDTSLDALLGASASSDAAPSDVGDVTQAAELLRKLSAHMEAHAAA